MELIRRLLVGLLGMIDAVIYDLVGRIYNLLMDIARATPFNAEIFETFADRVYALLGLFMLFKVSFSLIKYIVNPDDFNDKAKGGKKMIMNILVVLILMVATPMAFNEMRKVQQILLDEQVVEKLILGGGVNGEAVDMGTMGEKMKMEVFRAFYEINGDVDQSVLNAYNEAYSNNSVYDMIHKEVNNEPIFMARTKDGKDYAVNYMFIVSTVAGIFTGWIFLMFCFDIAIRTVKLGFLQLISPIPIISYIDPKSSQNGMFNKWIKEVGKTFIDLFVRLGAVYFAIALISSLIGKSDLGTSNSFAKVFIILGILLFAKQLPKLLGDLLGIKLDMNFNLNPMSRLRETPIIGAATAGLAGAAGGAYAGWKAGREVGTKGITSGIMGAATGYRQMSKEVGWQGSKPGAKAPKAFGTSMNNVFKQMTNREMTNLNPVNMFAGHMVKDRLKAVKTAKNNAGARLSAAQVAQETAFNQVQKSAGALNKLNDKDRQAFLEKVNYYTAMAQKRDDEKSSITEKEEAKLSMERIQDEINHTYTGEFADIAAHFQDRVAAQEAASTVALINKDLDDLSKEKAQIERFGHIDPVSTRDADSLIGKYASSSEPPSLTSPTPTTNISRNSNDQTVGGVRVNTNNDGLRSTPGGIVIPNNIDNDNHQNGQ